MYKSMDVKVSERFTKGEKEKMSASDITHTDITHTLTH